MPFARQGQLENKDVFAPEVVAEILVPIILAERAQLCDAKGVGQWKLSGAQLAIIDQHRIGKLDTEEIKAIGRKLESSDTSEAKQLSVDFQNRYSQQAVDREHKEDLRGGQNTIIVKRFWFFQRQQSTESFISDLLATPPIFFGGSNRSGFDFAFNTKQIKKIQLIANQLNQNQLGRLMRALDNYFKQRINTQFAVVTPYGDDGSLSLASPDPIVAALQQQLKEHLLMGKLLPDTAATDTYRQAYYNRNERPRVWLGVTARYGNRTLAQLINDIVDHVTIDANGRLRIQPSMQEIINSIPAWSKLDGSTPTFASELEKVFFRRINTQFHFTSSKVIESTFKKLKGNLQLLFASRKIPADLASDSKAAAQQTPGNTPLYLRRYYLLGLIPWGHTPVTVAEFAKKLLAHDFDWDDTTKAPQFSQAQINQLKLLNTELLGDPALKKAPVDALKQQIEATLLSRMKNGTIRFGGQITEITQIEARNSIFNGLNKVINDNIPNEALPTAQPPRGAPVNESKAQEEIKRPPVSIRALVAGESKNPFDIQRAEPSEATPNPAYSKLAEIKNAPFDRQINTLIAWAESVVNEKAIMTIKDELQKDRDRLLSEEKNNEKQEVYDCAIDVLNLRIEQLDIASTQKTLDADCKEYTEELALYGPQDAEYKQIKNALGEILKDQLDFSQRDTNCLDDIQKTKLALASAIEKWKRQSNLSQPRAIRRPAGLSPPVAKQRTAIQRDIQLPAAAASLTPVAGIIACGSISSDLSSVASPNGSRRSGSPSSRTSSEDGAPSSPLSDSSPPLSAASSVIAAGAKLPTPPSPLSIPSVTPAATRRSGSAARVDADVKSRITPPSPLLSLSVMADSSRSNGSRASMASSAVKKVDYDKKHKLFIEMEASAVENSDFTTLIVKTLWPLYKKHNGNLNRTIIAYREMIEERKRIPVSRWADSMSQSFRSLTALATESLTGTAVSPTIGLSTFNAMQAEDQIKTLQYYLEQHKNDETYAYFTDNGKYPPNTNKPTAQAAYSPR